MSPAPPPARAARLTATNHYSLSLETEAYLAAVNHPDFPSTEVRPGKPLHEVTVFRFGLPLRSGALSRPARAG